MAEAITIMIADDEHLVRKGIRHMLSNQLDYEIVAEASNGMEAVEMACRFQPQIILMDVKMPILDGLEALAMIRDKNFQTNTVILSGYSDFSYAQKAMRYGVSEYILKPADLHEILNVLSRLKLLINKEREDQQEGVKLKHQLSHGMLALIEQFYIKLLEDELLPDEIAEKMEILEIKEEQSIVLLVCPDNYYQIKLTNSKEQHLEFLVRIKLLIQRFVQKELEQEIPVIQTDKYYFILVFFSSAIMDAVPFAYALKNWLKVQAGSSFSVAIGPETGLKRLSSSYRVAVERLKQRIILGQDVVITQETTELSTNLHYPIEIEKDLAKAIRFGDQEQAQHYLNLIFDKITSSGKLTSNCWFQLCFDLVEMGYRIAKEFNILQLVSVIERVAEISALSTETDIKSWISHYFSEIIEKIKDVNAGPSWEVKKAISYIEEHFAENLTLASVAAQINLSPNYLSQMFKKSTGKTFLEHLTYCRIEEAKKLLRQEKLNISEISFRIGYDSQRYFSHVFAKTEGLTPSEFKKQIR